jgi:hypothetical protein
LVSYLAVDVLWSLSLLQLLQTICWKNLTLKVELEHLKVLNWSLSFGYDFAPVVDLFVDN